MKCRNFYNYSARLKSCSEPQNIFFQDDSTVSLAREDKVKPSSSGTLDPIGGGNLVRIVDPELETEFVSSLESVIDNQVKI